MVNAKIPIIILSALLLVCIVWLAALTTTVNRARNVDFDTLSVGRLFIKDAAGIDRIAMGTDRHSAWLVVRDANDNIRLEYEDYGDGVGGHLILRGRDGYRDEIRLDAFHTIPNITVKCKTASTCYTVCGEMLSSN
jgi:hypothetical protein